MQVSYRGGSPLYFWPNYSLASRASPDVELRPVLLLVRRDYPPFTFLLCLHLFCVSLFLSFFLFLSLSLRFSVYLHVPSLVISLRWLRGVRYFSFFFLEPLDVSLFFPLHRRFLRSTLSMSRALSCSLSTGCWQIGSRRPAVKFILLPCTATMIAASAF